MHCSLYQRSLYERPNKNDSIKPEDGEDQDHGEDLYESLEQKDSENMTQCLHNIEIKYDYDIGDNSDIE